MSSRTMDLNIAKPLTLKCGLVLPNRLTKAALAETMADARGLPTSKLDTVYKEWADGGWGMLLTGPHSAPWPAPPR